MNDQTKKLKNVTDRSTRAKRREYERSNGLARLSEKKNLGEKETDPSIWTDSSSERHNQHPVFWWESSYKPIPEAFERGLIPVLLKDKNEVSFFRSQPENRLNITLREVCTTNYVPLATALSLRRHHVNFAMASRKPWTSSDWERIVTFEDQRPSSKKPSRPG